MILRDVINKDLLYGVVPSGVCNYSGGGGGRFVYITTLKALP